MLAVTAFASNCSGGSFSYGSDNGSPLPYDDVQAYTACSENSYHTGSNSCWVAATVEYGSKSVSGYDSGTNESYYTTGWVVLSGYDNATAFRHTGSYTCTASGCTAKNSLSYP